MNESFEILKKLYQAPLVSGMENLHLPSEFGVKKDEVGNLFVEVKGTNATEKKKRILLEAHMDEIGLCVSEILDGGFVKAVPCGGIDTGLIAGTEFIIFGQKATFAIGISVPPHLKSIQGDEKDSPKEIILDTGISDNALLEKQIQVGDVVVFNSLPITLLGGKVSGRSLDNKAGVLSLLLTLKEMKEAKNDIVFLFSVGEETTSRGVRAFLKGEKFDFCVVLDAGFAYQEGLDESRCILSGKGPSVSYTDTLSVTASDFVRDTANKHEIPLQIIAEPGGTGTSATAIQTLGGGTPTAVVSIPVFYMHSPSEILDLEDVEITKNLLLAIDEEIENLKIGGVVC